MGATDIFVILFLFFLTAIFLAWYFIHRSKEKERLLLIEQGVDLSKSPETGAFRINFRFPWLKIGVIIVSTSIGLLIGILMRELGWIRHEVIQILFFLFAGIGLIVAHYIDQPNGSD